MSKKPSEKVNNQDTAQEVINNNTLKEVNLELLGERLRQVRKSKHLSQCDVSQGLFTSAYLSSIELGKSRPTYDNLKQLAQRLDKSVEYFLRPSPFHSTTSKEPSYNEQEQERVLRVRAGLNQLKVLLSKRDLEKAFNLLEELRDKLFHLPLREQIAIHLGQAALHNIQKDAGKALQELGLIGPLLNLQKQTESISPDILATIDFESGMAYYVLKNFSKALACFQTGLRREISNNPTLERKIKLQIGRCFLAVNDITNASIFLKPLMEKCGADTSAPDTGSIYYAQRGCKDWLQDAFLMGQYAQIWTNEHENTFQTGFYLEYAWFLCQIHKFEEALKLVQKTFSNFDIQSLNRQIEILVLLARLENRLKHEGAACDWLYQATRMLETEDKIESRIFFRYWQTAAEIASKQDRCIDEAIKHYQKALSYYPIGSQDQEKSDVLTYGVSQAELKEIYFELGQQLRQCDRLEEALIYFAQAYYFR